MEAVIWNPRDLFSLCSLSFLASPSVLSCSRISPSRVKPVSHCFQRHSCSSCLQSASWRLQSVSLSPLLVLQTLQPESSHLSSLVPASESRSLAACLSLLLMLDSSHSSLHLPLKRKRRRERERGRRVILDRDSHEISSHCLSPAQPLIKREKICQAIRLCVDCRERASDPLMQHFNPLPYILHPFIASLQGRR